MKFFNVGLVASSLALITLGAGCASGPDDDRWSDRVEMKERTIEEIEIEQEEAEQVAEATAEKPVTTDAEVFVLTPGEPYVTQSQLTVSVRKGAEPPQISFARDGKVEVVTLAEPALYKEGVVLEELYSVRQMGDQLVVTMHSDLPTEPLSVDEALERARAEKASRVGCEGVDGGTEVLPNGTFLLNVKPSALDEGEASDGVVSAGPVIPEDDRISITPVGCQIVIGRYTRRPVEL